MTIFWYPHLLILDSGRLKVRLGGFFEREIIYNQMVAGLQILSSGFLGSILTINYYDKIAKGHNILGERSALKGATIVPPTKP
jgi:hypothetical protein